MGTIDRLRQPSADNEVRERMRSEIPPPLTRAHRVLAQFQMLAPEMRSRRWAITLARTEGGLSFYGAGVTFFVFEDLSTLFLHDEGLRFGGMQKMNFFEHPYGERVYL
ncbi:hypothetical protein [Methylobacterium oxalidis]|uniref:Uncharacterized protein n=1 Tax=Methylobacterium oxalidis TaxID=944322 RepID=A0A512JD99_9HYPH|nr:hypothetical protein [Methylobacterium oxalidis]GEP07887.1 hypothetical protein MOX02_59250 [Methylobacterium oxalidis]GLS64855.1 hypothetical protein GCM10007888_32360 [Methylobacterium oxalidis]